MRLYAEPSAAFIDDAVNNRVAEKLKSAFLSQYRYDPSPSEVTSWRNSLRALSQVVQTAGLTNNGIMLELQLPMMSRRLDCMITGRDASNRPQAVVIELKQWEETGTTDGDSVVTFVGGAHRDVLHPSVQVGSYARYLSDCHTAFHEGSNPVCLAGCVYLHNYIFEEDDPVLAPKFERWVKEFPVFSADDVGKLIDYLRERLGNGDDGSILHRIEQSNYKASKKLLEHVGRILDGKSEYVMVDEQLVAFDRVMTAARNGVKDRRKTVVLVQGGPGTGKSVIALNLVAKLAELGRNAQYATGSQAFTETLRKIAGDRAAVQFRYFNSYMTAEPSVLDVLVCDEAHRLRVNSVNQYTPAVARTGKSQIQELIDVSKVSVFFIDDKQVVRPGEVGSSDLVRNAAKENNCIFHELKLEAQFRCAGSDGFVNWVANTLGVQKTANILWNGNESFEFRIASSPEELDQMIRARLEQGHTARLTAGFCWEWSKDLNPDGSLKHDVTIGGFRRPWNARPDARRLKRGIPKAPLWAYSKGGEDQVGCVYTAQGFEFDYVGVIFGTDLVYSSGQWIGKPDRSHDSVVKRAQGDFATLVKNTYRVLLTRGLKGCYVCFLDKGTEDFFRSRMES